MTDLWLDGVNFITRTIMDLLFLLWLQKDVSCLQSGQHQEITHR
jgi:hypothetical protein